MSRTYKYNMQCYVCYNYILLIDDWENEGTKSNLLKHAYTQTHTHSVFERMRLSSIRVRFVCACVSCNINLTDETTTVMMIGLYTIDAYIKDKLERVFECNPYNIDIVIDIINVCKCIAQESLASVGCSFCSINMLSTLLFLFGFLLRPTYIKHTIYYKAKHIYCKL